MSDVRAAGATVEPATDDAILDVRGAMALLHLSRYAVYSACGRNELPHRRIGRAIRFSRAGLLRWLDSTNRQGGIK